MMDEIHPLPKELYEKCVRMSVEEIHIAFSGGSDEGYISSYLCFHGDTVPWNQQPKELRDQRMALDREVEEWATDVYDYNGAGDGTEYGDDVRYKILDGVVEKSEWYTQRVNGDESHDVLMIKVGDDDNQSVSVKDYSFSEPVTPAKSSEPTPQEMLDRIGRELAESMKPKDSAK